MQVNYLSFAPFQSVKIGTDFLCLIANQRVKSGRKNLPKYHEISPNW